jgi:flavin-dependent dehydrogenase
MASRECDVVVVGGGPAGALAATYLAQRGYQVVLLERQLHPRPSVGESLIPDFWRYCDEAGVSPRLQAEGFVRKAGGTVTWGGRTQRLSFADFGFTRPALHVERDRFDAILLDHARGLGVQVRETVTAEQCLAAGPDGLAAVDWRDAGGGRGRLTCRNIVDATGQGALVGRQLDLCVADPAMQFVAVWGYFAGADYVAADGSIHPAGDVLAVPPTTYVSSLPLDNGWGWSWHIALRESTSVGLILPLGAFRALRQSKSDTETFYLRTCAAVPVLGRLLRDADFIAGSLNVIRDFSYSTRQPAMPGCYLIGDAAGFVDPIFSIGVVLAMYGARIAAWAIDQSLRRPDRAAQYQALFAAQLQSRFALSRHLALPGQANGADADSDLRQMMQCFGRGAQDLMHAATCLTGREPNFTAVMDDAAVFAAAPPRVRPIEILAI